MSHRVPIGHKKERGAKVLAAILADCSPKAGAVDCGESYTAFNRWVHELGFRRMYVTDAERAAVMRMRKAAA